MQNVSTKTGDTGTTSLANGKRVSKADPVFTVIGSIDEVNSWLGLIAAKFEHEFSQQRDFLYEIQDTLFYVGAELASSPKASFKEAALATLEKRSKMLQDSMAEGWHTKFLLPGGTELGGFLDIARSVCRRAERELVQYGELDDTDLNPLLLKYVNRLSDYLYVLRCFVNNRVEYAEQEFEAKAE